MPDSPNILFTAFEPSGDALAAPMIQRLLQLRPDLNIHAFGGPKMRDAGARLIDTTTEHAAMLLGAASQIMSHRRRLHRLDDWLADHQIAALVPVDSPAANWSICKLVRRTQPDAKIVHLAAPQLWAWAPWRINKLRRLTDHVLCLLPFEQDWFTHRRVPATFVGHPLFDPSLSHADNAQVLFSDGQPRLALLPGSRAGEIRANWPTMFQAAVQLHTRHPNLRATIAVPNQDLAQLVRETSRATTQQGGWPDWLDISVANTEAVLSWADVVLVVSGTATLQVVAHRKPMVVLYNVSKLTWHLFGRWVIQTKTFSLPNLIAQSDGLDRPVPEFVPHFAQSQPVAEALEQLIRDPDACNRQLAAFDHISRRFADRSFSHASAGQLLRTIE